MVLLILILLILGLACFLLAAFGAGHPRVSLGWLGLAFWITTAIISAWPK